MRRAPFTVDNVEYYAALLQDRNHRERERYRMHEEYKERTGDKNGTFAAEYALKMEREFYGPHREEMAFVRWLQRSEFNRDAMQ